MQKTLDAIEKFVESHGFTCWRMPDRIVIEIPWILCDSKGFNELGSDMIEVATMRQTRIALGY